MRADGRAARGAVVQFFRAVAKDEFDGLLPHDDRSGLARPGHAVMAAGWAVDEGIDLATHKCTYRIFVTT